MRPTIDPKRNIKPILIERKQVRISGSSNTTQGLVQPNYKFKDVSK